MSNFHEWRTIEILILISTILALFLPVIRMGGEGDIFIITFEQELFLPCNFGTLFRA